MSRLQQICGHSFGHKCLKAAYIFMLRECETYEMMSATHPGMLVLVGAADSSQL